MVFAAWNLEFEAERLRDCHAEFTSSTFAQDRPERKRDSSPSAQNDKSEGLAMTDAQLLLTVLAGLYIIPVEG